MNVITISRTFLPRISLVLAVVLLIGFLEPVHAAAPQTLPPPHSLCNDATNAGVKGFTVAVIYCVKASLSEALTGVSRTGGAAPAPTPAGGYIGQVVKFLAGYKWAAITLAFALYGVKLSTVSVEELLKESASLLFRMAIVLWLVDNMATYYGAATDAAGELVTWVSAGFAQVTQSCTPDTIPSGANAAEYTVWQEYDCMFGSLMGAAFSGASITLTIVVIIAAAVFSGGLGVIVVMLAITAFIMVLITLARSIYVLLLSYFVLALLFVIGPLIVPILVFDNKFLREIFWKWVGLIMSTIFQPMFIIGFLSFSVMVMDTFVEGVVRTDGTSNGPISCQFATFSGTKQTSQGSGICSFKQLLTNQQNPGNPTQSDIERKQQANTTDTWTLNGDPQAQGFGAWLKRKFLQGTSKVLQWIGGLVGIHLPSFTQLYQFPINQLFVTLVAFMIVIFVLKDLLDVVPHIARAITISVGIGLIEQAQIPFEGVIASAVKGGGDAMQQSMKKSTSEEGGIMGRAKAIPRAALKGMQGAASKAGRYMKDNY